MLAKLRYGSAVVRRGRQASLRLSSCRCMSSPPSMIQKESVEGSSSFKEHDTLKASRPELEPSQNSSNSTGDFLEQLKTAAAWNHGQPGKPYDTSLWDPDFCRTMVDRYDAYLNQLANDNSRAYSAEQQELLSAETVTLAFKVLLKSKPDNLSTHVREWERALGKLKLTPLTDHLSIRLLTANGKAGNVGRVLALLNLRKSRQFNPRYREFVAAITSLRAAQAPRMRNIFSPEQEQPDIDNPTRWLDAILLNMREREFPLTIGLANRMLHCYAAGYTGKAVHHFYRVIRRPLKSVEEDNVDGGKGVPSEDSIADMPHDWFYLPDDGYQFQPVKVQMDFNHSTPPFYKKPSEVRGKVLFYSKDGDQNQQQEGMTKIERECDPDYSPSLTAAFAFAESLQHGACGHDSIQLNSWSYNALIKASVQRGALWRAMHVLDDVMPQEGLIPNNVSYNLILAGLARVGDVVTAQEYYQKLLNSGLEPDAFTVRAIVDGLLNLGDSPAAITVIQDFFNQHCILPPYTTHLKIIEVCLARDMIHESRRHLYFLQQLWHWEPNAYHSENFIRLMRATQQNTQLQKPALQKLFAYFGESLNGSDFL